jgi:hypothetical protein
VLKYAREGCRARGLVNEYIPGRPANDGGKQGQSDVVASITC